MQACTCIHTHPHPLISNLQHKSNIIHQPITHQIAPLPPLRRVSCSHISKPSSSHYSLAALSIVFLREVPRRVASWLLSIRPCAPLCIPCRAFEPQTTTQNLSPPRTPTPLSPHRDNPKRVNVFYCLAYLPRTSPAYNLGIPSGASSS